MPRRRLAALLLVSTLAACRTAAPDLAWQSAVGRDHPLAGRVWDVSRSRFVDEGALVASLSRARYVLLGEKHDNPDHHRLQARLVTRLIAAGRRPGVAFEMFTTDQAPALARHLTERPRDAAGIAEAVNWNASGWPDWAMYEPIARAALDAGLPIVAANLSGRQVRLLRQQGFLALDRAFVERHALEAPLRADLERAMTDEIRESHCGHVSVNLVAGMVAVQRARDARMAEAMLQAPGGDGAVLIAGSGHVRNDRGVPAYLARLAPRAPTVSVAFTEVHAPRRVPAEYADRFLGACRENDCHGRTTELG